MKNKEDKNLSYPAHYNRDINKYQSVYEHSEGTKGAALMKCSNDLLKMIVELTCILHDCGKLSDRWRKYFQKRIQEIISTGDKEDHSTAGGLLIERLMPGTLLAQMVQLAIYSHHGLQDSISLDDDVSLFVKRRNKSATLPIEECWDNFFQIYDKAEIMDKCKKANEECKKIIALIKQQVESWEAGKLYGNKDFFLGMYERILMSLLIDADRRDTEDFMSGNETKALYSDEEIQKTWDTCCNNLETAISALSVKKKDDNVDEEINACRSEISEACRKAADTKEKLLQLSVPTGAGKTLSSLRFAVHYAKKHHKKKIIYVAPFQSIVEQNAKEIRNALGMPEIVLEHHCNIIKETEEEQAWYDRVTEDWASFLVVTTAIQFMNTLYADKTGNVRRMHSLCDSVIIIDEVQALPVKVMELLNLAMNFLTEFAGATVVLCTATQPLLDKLPQNRLLVPRKMISHAELYQQKLKRIEIEDCTNAIPGGMDIEQATQFALDKVHQYKKVLLIVNTKACARELYQKLGQLCGKEVTVQHLSTSMYPKHRMNVLDEIREMLKCKEKMQICISTQLIEAGVDISFPCVIRSMTGLDSLVQAAGRCNRNREAKLGYVYLIKMNLEVENVSRMPSIYKAQNAMQSVLTQFQRNSKSFDDRLDSDKAVRYYFERYLAMCENETCYPVNELSTNLVELLSQNSTYTTRENRGQMFKQAFKTAGEVFEMIDDQAKTGIIVCDNESVENRIRRLEDENVSTQEKKKILRELQPYTVSISRKEMEATKDGIRTIWDGRVQILDKRYYDKKTGVVTEPPPLETWMM